VLVISDRVVQLGRGQFIERGEQGSDPSLGVAKYFVRRAGTE
jgi:hypothetical protein